MFIKIQTLLDLNVYPDDSLTVRCLCVVLYLFFCDQQFVSGFVPRFLLQGIRFWLKWLLVCDRVWSVACWRLNHPTCPMRRGGSLALPAPKREVKDLPGSGQTGPCTHRHTHINIYDGHQRQAQLCFLRLNSTTLIIKCPPTPIKTNSLDCELLLSIGLTDTNDCVIHPPQFCPLLSAPVSHRALPQSREIVSCLFLNTHLYLTAYWVSISLNVHSVWMCSQACVCECVSACAAGLRLQCDMPVMFASLSHLEGVLVHQAAGVVRRGGCLAEGGLVVGGLKTHMHPHPVSGRKIPGVEWAWW